MILGARGGTQGQRPTLLSLEVDLDSGESLEYLGPILAVLATLVIKIKLSLNNRSDFICQKSKSWTIAEIWQLLFLLPSILNEGV